MVKKITAILLTSIFFAGTVAVGTTNTHSVEAATQSSFTVKYHADDTANASSKTTKVQYGVSTKTLTASQLGFSKTGKSFAGWKAYREVDDKWFVTDKDGKTSWTKLTNGKLASGSSFCLYKNGTSVAKTAPSGTVHLYAQWKDSVFTVKYHADDTANASSKTTKVQYGVSTKTLTASQLGFSKAGKSFAGWKAYREVDDKWFVTDKDGKTSWTKLTDGKLPSGSSFCLYKNGTSVAKTAPSGTVHLYAQWKDNVFTVKYHADDTANASSKTTKVQYGVSTKTLTASQLGFAKAGKSFVGWKAYREVDDKWFVTDKDGKTSWTKLTNGKLPSGSSFCLYKNGTSVAKTAPSGNVHLYAQWKDNVFTVKYHADDTANASSKTTSVQYGVSTKTLTTAQLGFSKTGLNFKGWKAYREVDDKWYVTDKDGKTSWTKLTNGELPEGSSFCLYKNGTSVSKTAPSGTVHLYAQWIGDTINVADFGANGTDELSDWTAIQNCLNFGKDNDNHLKVVIGPGRYYIDHILTVYSNTELILDENAEIIRMNQGTSMLKSESDSKTGGYGQSHDITIKGGKWKGNITSLDERSAALFIINHAQGITLEDFEISQCSTRHMVQFDGVKDVVVRNVTFADQIAYTGEDNGATEYIYHSEYKSDKTHNPDNSFKNMEALHFDIVSEDGVSSGALPLDGTRCQNILVENCTFKNLFSGVGSHYSDNTGLRSNNIIIRNNSFKDVKYSSIHVCQYDNAKVYDNTAEDVGELLRINKSSGEVYNNTATIKNSLIGSPKDARFYGIWVYQGTSLTTLENNSISGALDNGISVIEGSSVENLKNNTLINSGNHGIWISDSTIGNIISNNIEGTAKSALYVYNNSSVTKMENNILSDSGDYGIIISQNANGGDIINNTVDKTGNTGVLINTRCEASSINGNTISNTIGHGISMVLSTCGEVNNNRINGVTGENKDGILSSGSTVTKINGNEISNVNRDGININKTGETFSTISEICNNTIESPGRRGVGVYGGSVVSLNENNSTL